MTFWKIATSTLLALAWSLPASATHEDRRSERRDRDGVRMERLAVGLEDAARTLDRRIRDARHRHRGYEISRSQERAFRAIHDLKDASKHFRKQTEKNRRSLAHLAEDFDRVSAAFQTAVYRVDRAHLSRDLDRELRWVGHWMDKVVDRTAQSTDYAKVRKYDDRNRFEHGVRVGFVESKYNRYNDGKYSYNKRNGTEVRGISYRSKHRYSH